MIKTTEQIKKLAEKIKKSVEQIEKSEEQIEKSEEQSKKQIKKSAEQIKKSAEQIEKSAEQIEKSEEQIEKSAEQINQASYFKGLDNLASNEPLKIEVGINQLLELTKLTNYYTEKIKSSLIKRLKIPIEKTPQPKTENKITLKNILLFLVAFIIYVAVDVGYNFVGSKIEKYFYSQAGILDVYTQNYTHLLDSLVFFIVIALINLVFVILPTIKENNVAKAFCHGFLLGILVYTPFSYPLLWTIKNYPLELSTINILSGGIFCLATSGFTTWIYLKFLFIKTQIAKNFK